MQTYSVRSGRRVAETQSDSYHAITVRELATSQAAVMALFPDASVCLTREEIAQGARMKLSAACGRARELIDAGRLEVRGRRYVIESKREQQLLGLPVKAQFISEHSRA